MSGKPDGTTWKQYLGTPVDPAGNDYMRFCELMVEQSRTVIEEADELDADRYRVEINDGPAIVRGDGWEMEGEDAKRVGGILSDHDIGDRTVDVYASGGQVQIGLIDGEVRSESVLDRVIAEDPYQQE